MGMRGCYMAVDDGVLNRIADLSREDIFDLVEDLEEKEESDIYDIDKLWDGLHFLLTGEPGDEPLPGNHLSAAVLGARMIGDGDEDDYIGIVRKEEIPDILEALGALQAEKLYHAFDLERFRENDIYPDVWDDENENELFEELIDGLEDLTAFYSRALATKQNVIFTWI